MRRLFSFATVLVVTLFLAACESAEDRAEGYFQNALTLLSEGDVDRAIVELRNVFTLVPNHLEARRELARAFLIVEKDDPRQAYSQYLRLVEQYPDDLDARIALSELAFLVANWEELVRHGTVARELDPENERVKIIGSALDYRAALVAEDDVARVASVEVAKQLLENATDTPNQILQELILDDLLRNRLYSEALIKLDDLTTKSPDSKRYWLQRLQVLIALGDPDAVEAQLVDLVARYPDDDEQKQTLVRYLLARGELDKTEAFLRELVEQAPEGDTGTRTDLVRFLMELRSVDAARAELVNAIANEVDPVPFIVLKAALDYSIGNTDDAVRDLETAIERSEPSNQTNEMKTTLAQMLLSTGNEVGARSLVEEVLLEDPSQPDAIKLNAAWLIEADDTDGAIAALRTALDANADDPETMTLMAEAYLRTGSTGLARDFLSLAVEASGNAPAETIRYAQLLISEERYLPAEDTLLPALRIAPNDVNLLRTTAQLYLAMDDLGRMQQVIETLRRVDTAPANRLAIELEAERLSRTGGREDVLDYLEGLASASNSDDSARLMLARARLSVGDFEEAILLVEALLADNPESAAMKVMLATTLANAGDIDRALVIYNDLLEEFPDEAGLQTDMAKLHERNGNPELARATILEALDVTPDDPGLMWASASYSERDGNIDDAIAVYEDLYRLESGNIVAANNLASLLATYRNDEESLDRAWTIARRFRDSDIPAIQDTYGWIAHRRGESEEALSYVRAAAGALSGDAIVQFHFAEVLFALNRTQEARDQYRISLDLAGIGDTRPQILTARDRLAEIDAIVVEQDD